MSDENLLSKVEELLDVVVEKKFLERKTETTIQQKFEAEEAKRFRNLSFIVAAISLIGVGTLSGWVVLTFKSTVRSEVESINQAFVDDLELAQFQILANQLKFSDGFSDEQALRAINYLTEFRSKKSLTEKESFQISFRDTVDAFVAASRNQNLDTIFTLYANEIAADKSLLRSLTNHYGLKLLSRQTTPKKDQVLEAFEYLEGYAAELNYPELPMVYRLPYENYLADNRKVDRIVGLIDRVSTLSDVDKASFFTQALLTTNPQNWMAVVTADGEVISQRMQAFLRVYKDEIISTFSIADSSIYEMAMNGELGGSMEGELLSAYVAAYAAAIVNGKTGEFSEIFSSE